MAVVIPPNTVQVILGLVEQYGPGLLKEALSLAAPGLPLADLVDVADHVALLIAGKSEKQQLQELVQADDAAESEAEKVVDSATK